ncbi:hypothetical protein Dimus_027233, partial [Dionaea muscipula]
THEEKRAEENDPEKEEEAAEEEDDKEAEKVAVEAVESKEVVSKGEAVKPVDKVIEEIVTSLGQRNKAQSMEMVLYEKTMATEFSQPTPFIHDHF